MIILTWTIYLTYIFFGVFIAEKILDWAINAK